MNSRILFANLFVVLHCFLSYTNAEFRIINGEYIAIKDSAHVVAIFHCSIHICVGSIISLNSVVTDAKCVFGKQFSNLDVLAGADDISDINTESGQRLKVQDIIFDPECYQQSPFLKIAVVKVDGNFRRQPNKVMPVELCDTALEPGMDMRVNAWGSIISSGYDYLSNRQTTTMPIEHTNQCRDHYKNIFPSLILPNTIICAGCSGSTLGYGDAGAGALVNDKLCAVAHFTAGSLDIPELFTNLTNARIQEFLKPHTS